MKRIFILLIALLLVSCEDPRLKGMLVTVKERYTNYLDLIDHGIWGEPRAGLGGYSIRSKRVNTELLELIEIKKEELYKDNEIRYNKHKALLHLYKSDLVTGFNLLKRYADETGDYAQVYYHIAAVMSYCFRDFTSWKVIEELEIEDCNSLTDEQMKVVIKQLATIEFIDRYLEHNENIVIYEEAVKRKRHHTEEINKRMLDGQYMHTSVMTYKRYLQQTYSMWKSRFYNGYFKDLESQEEHSAEDQSFLLGYYAASYSVNKKVNLLLENINIDNILESKYKIEQITLMMKAYISNKQYIEAINLYDEYLADEDNYNILSNYHTYLLLSVAYAGISDIDRTIQYLEKDLSICSLYNRDHRSDMNGSFIESMFLVYFIYDEFDILWDMNRFEEIEMIMQTNLERFKDLKYFNVY